MQQVGTLAALFRYPVKSMAGEAVETALLRWHGLAGDRRFAFVRRDDASGFPWLTIRQVPAMTTLRARVAGADPESGDVVVRTDGGADLEIRSEALRADLEARYGGPLHLLRTDRGAFDSMPVSITTSQAVATVGRHAGAPVTPERFRPNVVIDAAGEPEDFPEDAWIGSRLILGDGEDAPVVRVDRPDERCSVVNFEPLTAARNPAVLRAIARHHANRFGVYGSIERPGIAAVGATVYLEPAPTMRA